jgi:hypothetical protein
LLELLVVGADICIEARLCENADIISAKR